MAYVTFGSPNHIIHQNNINQQILDKQLMLLKLKYNLLLKQNQQQNKNNKNKYKFNLNIFTHIINIVCINAHVI